MFSFGFPLSYRTTETTLPGKVLCSVNNFLASARGLETGIVVSFIILDKVESVRATFLGFKIWSNCLILSLLQD